MPISAWFNSPSLRVTLYYGTQKARPHENKGFGLVVLCQKCNPRLNHAAFYIYADCSRWTDDSFKLAWRLLEEAHVAITPGKDFGLNEPQRHLRFAYTASLERQTEGLR